MVAGVVLFLVRSSTTHSAPAIVPLTSYPGFECCPTFSPDGNQVAFWWSEGKPVIPGAPGLELGSGGVYVKVIGTDMPVRLAGNGATDPAWSPDGRWIAFARPSSESPTKAGVFLIPAAGGAKRKLADMYPTMPGALCCNMSWYPDGNWLAVGGRNTASDAPGLFLLSVETGENRRLTSLPNGFDGNPAFSPDGRQLVFVRNVNSDNLYVLEIPKNLRPVDAPKRLNIQGKRALSAAWTPDKKSILFSEVDADRELWKLEVDWPRRLERMAVAGHGIHTLTFSRQGRLAYGVADWDSDIWRLELDSGHRVVKPTERLIGSTRMDYEPQYSPDGKRITFGSNRSGSHEIWVCDNDGSHPVQLTSVGGPFVGDPSWSPDGTHIAFKVMTEEAAVHVIGANGGRSIRLATGDVSSWSSDGKWIYFDLKDSVWKVPIDGGRAVEVTKNGGGFAFESSDRRFLYYQKPAVKNMASLWRMPLEGGDESQVIESMCGQYYAVTSGGIYFFTSWYDPSLKFYSFSSRKAQTVADISGGIDWGLSVSPDGRWLLYSRMENKGSDLMLVENFR